MGKFNYLTSEDHARWYVVNPRKGVEVKSSILDSGIGLRVQIREWVEDHCNHTVYAWNKTATPLVGEPNWAKMVMPQGDMVMHFEDEQDRLLFVLTWT